MPYAQPRRSTNDEVLMDNLFDSFMDFGLGEEVVEYCELKMGIINKSGGKRRLPPLPMPFNFFLTL